MASHKLLACWIVLFIIFFIVTLTLSIITRGARFVSIFLVILIIIFVLFCPIIIIDRKQASEYKKKEKEKAKEIELKQVELEIEKEKLELDKLKLQKESEEVSGNFCKYCGAKLDAEAKICPNCGTPLEK